MKPSQTNPTITTPLKKIKLHMFSPNNQPCLQLSDALVRKAINKSYTKQMARNDQVLEVQHIIQDVASYALTFLMPVDVQEQMKEYWCIVALNQDKLNQSIDKGISMASYHYGQNADPNTLKLYQLFIGLGTKQFRFQSLSSYKKNFIINVDVVQCQYIPTNQNSVQDVNRIRFIADDKYLLDFFINKATLPFRANQLFNAQKSQQILKNIYQHTNRLIGHAIDQSKAKKYLLSSKLLKQQQFYHNKYATEQQFSNFCQPGDILLFRDNHTFAKIQRFLTNSECDHVGIVYKDERYGLCIFQSNSSTGVSLAMWNQLIRYKWFENIQGIYWRRLDVQVKPSNFEDKIKQFVKVNLHKKYGISVGKLLRFKEIVYQSPQQEKNRTFFCSELIAALYKYLGLLEPNKASSTYLPKDFTDKGSINMINNSALQAQRKIIFNDNLLKQSYKFYK